MAAGGQPRRGQGLRQKSCSSKEPSRCSAEAQDTVKHPGHGHSVPLRLSSALGLFPWPLAQPRPGEDRPTRARQSLQGQHPSLPLPGLLPVRPTQGSQSPRRPWDRAGAFLRSEPEPTPSSCGEPKRPANRAFCTDRLSKHQDVGSKSESQKNTKCL